MCDTVESWRAGATWYRNSMKWAQEERDDAIRVANEVLNQKVPVVPPFAANAGASLSSRGSQLGEEEDDDEHHRVLFSCWKIAKERIDSLISSLSFEAGHSPTGR